MTEKEDKLRRRPECNEGITEKKESLNKNEKSGEESGLLGIDNKNIMIIIHKNKRRRSD